MKRYGPMCRTTTPLGKNPITCVSSVENKQFPIRSIWVIKSVYQHRPTCVPTPQNKYRPMQQNDLVQKSAQNLKKEGGYNERSNTVDSRSIYPGFCLYKKNDTIIVCFWCACCRRKKMTCETALKPVSIRLIPVRVVPRFF